MLARPDSLTRATRFARSPGILPGLVLAKGVQAEAGVQRLAVDDRRVLLPVDVGRPCRVGRTDDPGRLVHRTIRKLRDRYPI